MQTVPNSPSCTPINQITETNQPMLARICYALSQALLLLVYQFFGVLDEQQCVYFVPCSFILASACGPYPATFGVFNPMFHAVS